MNRLAFFFLSGLLAVGCGSESGTPDVDGEENGGSVADTIDSAGIGAADE